MAKNKKKKLNGLDRYVIFSIISMIIFTITSQLILVRTGYTNDTLTTCFFGFFGGEIVTCALIKIFKLAKFDKEKIPKVEWEWNHPDSPHFSLGYEREEE